MNLNLLFCWYRSLDWSLTVLMPIHFVHLYVARPPNVPIFSDDVCTARHRFHCDHDEKDFHQHDLRQIIIPSYMEHLSFIVNMCLQEYTFLQYSPSMLATAMLAVARRLVNITYDKRQLYYRHRHRYLSICR